MKSVLACRAMSHNRVAEVYRTLLGMASATVAYEAKLEVFDPEKLGCTLPEHSFKDGTETGSAKKQ